MQTISAAVPDRAKDSTSQFAGTASFKNEFISWLLQQAGDVSYIKYAST